MSRIFLFLYISSQTLNFLRLELYLWEFLGNGAGIIDEKDELDQGLEFHIFGNLSGV